VITTNPGNSIEGTSSSANCQFMLNQRLAPIHVGERLGMDGLVAEPGESARVEGLDQPIDDLAHPRDAPGIGMVGEPDVEHAARVEVDRDEAAGDGRRIGHEPADAGAAGDRQRMGAAGIGANADQVGLRPVAEDLRIREALRKT
jgi:hypothetical protein